MHNDPIVKGPIAPKGTALPCASQVPTIMGMKRLGNSATTVASYEWPNADNKPPLVTTVNEKKPLKFCKIKVKAVCKSKVKVVCKSKVKEVCKSNVKAVSDLQKCCAHDTDLVPAGAGIWRRSWRSVVRCERGGVGGEVAVTITCFRH